MPRRAHPKPARRQTFIRSWRKHHEFTLAQVSERLAMDLQMGITPGQLSRIERGQTPYNQDFLEAAATVLGCEPADLIMRDPAQPDAIGFLLDNLAPHECLQAIEIIKALKRTGGKT